MRLVNDLIEFVPSAYFRLLIFARGSCTCFVCQLGRMQRSIPLIRQILTTLYLPNTAILRCMRPNWHTKQVQVPLAKISSHNIWHYRRKLHSKLFEATCRMVALGTSGCRNSRRRGTCYACFLHVPQPFWRFERCTNRAGSVSR